MKVTERIIFAFIALLVAGNLIAATPIKDLIFQGNADAGGYQITNLGSPTNSSNAATLGYVTNEIATAGTNYAPAAGSTNVHILGAITNGPTTLAGYGITNAANLSGTNTFTGPNTFQDREIKSTSSDDGTAFYPQWRGNVTGFAPAGRLTYMRDPVASDNPDQLHTALRLSINNDPEPGATAADDGSGVWSYIQLERKYQGAAVATITSSSTTSGVTTFTVNSTTGVFVGQGLKARGSSKSDLNFVDAVVTSITDATHFVATTTGVTNGSGTGGDLRGENQEVNSAMSGYRWLAVTGANANPSKDGNIGLSYRTTIAPPTDYASPGGLNHGAVVIRGSQPATNAVPDIRLSLINDDASNSCTAFTMGSTAASGFTITTDPLYNKTAKVLIAANAANVMGWVGTREIHGSTAGAAFTGDDTTTRYQFLNGDARFSGALTTGGAIVSGGAVSLTGDLTLTGNIVKASGYITSSATDFVDTSGGHALMGTSTNTGVAARRTGMSNGSGGQTIATFGGSPAANSTSYTDILSIQADWTAGAPNAGIIRTSGTLPIQMLANSQYIIIGGASYTLNVSGSILCTGINTDTGVARVGSGTAASPGLSFNADTNTGFYRFAADDLHLSTNGTDRGAVVAAVTKTDTGDPASGIEGQMCINTFDNTLKIYAEGSWRQIATW